MEPTDANRLRDIETIRRVRDRIDREFDQPLNVEDLARGVYMSAGHVSRLSAAFTEKALTPT